MDGISWNGSLEHGQRWVMRFLFAPVEGLRVRCSFAFSTFFDRPKGPKGPAFLKAWGGSFHWPFSFRGLLFLLRSPFNSRPFFLGPVSLSLVFSFVVVAFFVWGGPIEIQCTKRVPSFCGRDFLFLFFWFSMPRGKRPEAKGEQGPAGEH